MLLMCDRGKPAEKKRNVYARGPRDRAAFRRKAEPRLQQANGRPSSKHMEKSMHRLRRKMVSFSPQIPFRASGPKELIRKPCKRRNFGKPTTSSFALAKRRLLTTYERRRLPPSIDEQPH